MYRIKFPSKESVAHMFIFPWNGAGGLQRLSCLKYYNVREWENRFTLQQNAAKNIDYIEKGSNKNCPELISIQKTQ